ncbi:HPr family phosphocarrier protein, partial [Candidatus Ozemobacteraceae bacterium]|nr:HPr family phosphocarrier protein [Candidatus Ozemobacteraceae bacterium]
MTRNQPQMLALRAPLSGVLVPIELVPDPVFAQKIVGDGISIDPVDPVLKAPCDGTVTQVHSCGHAITFSPVAGLEIMMHIGIDTVHLKGDGFKPLVRMGDAIKAGQPLIEFEPDLIARRAASLLTQILVTTPERVVSMKPATGSVLSGSDIVLEIQLAEPAAGAPETGSDLAKTLTSEAVVVPNPTGFHARPAAVLAGLARRYKSEIRLHRGTTAANARSLVAIMGLDVRCGDKVHLTAKGPDAEAALAAILPAVRDGLGEGGGRFAQAVPAGTVTAQKSEAQPVAPASGDPNRLAGVSASPGLAVGRIRKLVRTDLHIPETAEAPEVERRKLVEALEQAKQQTGALHDRLAAAADAGKAAIFAAHQELMGDPDVLD